MGLGWGVGEDGVFSRRGSSGLAIYYSERYLVFRAEMLARNVNYTRGRLDLEVSSLSTSLNLGRGIEAAE